MPPIDGSHGSNDASQHHHNYASDQHLARRAIDLNNEISGPLRKAVADAELGGEEQVQESMRKLDEARHAVQITANRLELISSATDSVGSVLSLFEREGQRLPDSVYQVRNQVMGGERATARAQLETRLAQLGQTISELPLAEVLANTERGTHTTVGRSGARITGEWVPEQQARVLDTAIVLARADVGRLGTQLGSVEPRTAEQRVEETAPGTLPLGPISLKAFNAEQTTWPQRTLGHVIRAYHFVERDPENPRAQAYLGRVQEALDGITVGTDDTRVIGHEVEDSAVERTRELCAMLEDYNSDWSGTVSHPLSEEEVRRRYGLLQFDDMPLSSEWGRRQE